MSELILKDHWAQRGAVFGELGNSPCVKNFGDIKKEMHALRNSAAMCDISFTKRFAFSENDGIDFLDSVLAANILKLRYGKIIDTFLADKNGKIAAEILAANIDDKILVVAEQLGEESCAPLVSGEANAEDLSETHAMFSVDGPLSWLVAKDIFGADILNLPYLGVEKYDFDGECAYLLRGGKTGEFGYQFIAPIAVAKKLSEKIEESLKNVGGALCGFDAHKIARLEGNFFDIYEEGARVQCPLELGLQWMVDFGKESFAGSEKIFEKRKAGVGKKIVGIKTSEKIEAGANIYNGEKIVGQIIFAAESQAAGAFLATAIFDEQFAAAGFAFSASPNGVENIFTVSRPPIVPISLQKGMEQ